jgi:1-acyl-sn-glycerol-3-phosphate acyltransferase
VKAANTLRFAYRLPLLLWHVLVDLPITLLVMLPPLGRIDVRGEALEHRMIR